MGIIVDIMVDRERGRVRNEGWEKDKDSGSSPWGVEATCSKLFRGSAQQ